MTCFAYALPQTLAAMGLTCKGRERSRGRLLIRGTDEKGGEMRRKGGEGNSPPPK